MHIVCYELITTIDWGNVNGIEFWMVLFKINNFPVTFFSIFLWMFYVKTKWNSLQILQIQKSFQKTPICFFNGIKFWIFSDLFATIMGWLWLSLKHPCTHFREVVCLKNICSLINTLCSFFSVFFWLPHSKLWAIIEGSASLTQCC